MPEELESCDYKGVSDDKSDFDIMCVCALDNPFVTNKSCRLVIFAVSACQFVGVPGDMYE